MKKEREITIQFINNKNINYDRLAKFFARKYSENTNKNRKKKDSLN